MKLNLRTKLIGSFIIILLLLMVVVGLVGVYTSRNIENHLEDIVEQDVKTANILSVVTRRVSLIRSNSLLHLFTRSVEDMDRYESEIADWKGKISTDLDTLENIFKDQSALDKLAEFRTAWEMYLGIWNDQVVPLSRANRDEEAFALVRKRGAAGMADQEAMCKLDELHDAINATANDNLELAEQDFRKSQNILLAVIFLTISLGLYFGIKQSSLIAGAANTVSKAAKQVAAGDLDQSVILRTGDEIESMADSFNTMTSNMKKMVEELRNEITERLRAEQALQESEQWLSTTLRSIGDAVIATDDQGLVTFMNPVAEDLTGWGGAESAGKPLEDFLNIINEQTGERVDNPVDRVLREGVIVGLANHTVLIAKDGTKRPIADSGAPIRDKEGNIVGTVMVFRDITEAKQAEEELKKHRDHLGELVKERTPALRESEKRYRLLAENISDVIWTMDMNLKYTYISPSATRMSGFSVAEAMTLTLGDVLPPDSLETAMKVFAEEMAVEEKEAKDLSRSITMELEQYCKDGSTIWTEAKVTGLRDQGGQLVELLGISRDITERKRAEEKLRESEVQYRGLFERVPVGLYRTTQEGQILDANPAMVQMLGYQDQETLLATNVGELFVDSDDRGVEMNLLGKEETMSNFEMQLLRRDGDVIWVRDTFRAIRDSEDQIVSLEGSLEDITERRQAQESLQRRNREMALLNRVIAAASTTLSPKTVLETTCRELALAFDMPMVAAAILNDARTASVVVAEYLAEGYSSALDVVIPLEGNPTMQYIMEHKSPLVVVDAQHDPLLAALHDAMRQRGTISLLILPLMVGDQVVGTLGLDAVERREFSSEEIDLAVNAVNTAAQALENARLFSQANRQLKRMEALHSMDKVILASVNINLTADIFLDQALTQLEVNAASVLLFNPVTQTLDCVGRKGFRTSALKHTNLRLGEGQAGQVALQREIKYIPDLREEKEAFLASSDLSKEEFVAYYGIPLIAKGMLKGVLEIFHREPLSMDDEWLVFLNTMASQAAIAIDNASMFTDLQRSNIELGLAYDSTLEGWARALELHDMETEGHSRSVTEMTMHLAKAMGMDKGQLPHLYRGALLHDIGKMGVPDSILNKPGPLTDEEWVIMHQHPIYAYDMLSPIEYIRPALDIPYCHHEKWDGTGYPRGLQGEQIPFAARIFAIVDVWDALNSDRPYRKAWPKKKVIAHIKEQSRKHFDPQVVEVFLNQVLPK